MWRLATGREGGTANVDGLTGAESIAIFKRAIKKVTKNYSSFVELNPANGWGRADWFLERLKKCYAACQEYPDSIWQAYR